jgi:hypothetical protein
MPHNPLARRGAERSHPVPALVDTKQSLQTVTEFPAKLDASLRCALACCQERIGAGRILSPASVKQAATIQTGTLANEYFVRVMEEQGIKPPSANIGLDFQIRGEGVGLNSMGNLTSPGAYGKFASFFPLLLFPIVCQ